LLVILAPIEFHLVNTACNSSNQCYEWCWSLHSHGK